MTDDMNLCREALRRAEMKLRAYVGVFKDKELPVVIEMVQAAQKHGLPADKERAIKVMAKTLYERHYGEVQRKSEDAYVNSWLSICRKDGAPAYNALVAAYDDPLAMEGCEIS